MSLGHLNMTYSSDGKYVGSSTGLDEVNYKLQAFMELWKGLAHDVDDLYDKVIFIDFGFRFWFSMSSAFARVIQGFY